MGRRIASASLLATATTRPRPRVRPSSQSGDGLGCCSACAHALPCTPLHPPCRPACSWDGLAARHGDAVAVVDPHHLPAEQHSFAQLAAAIKQLAAGLQALGLRWGAWGAWFGVG